MKKLIPLLLCLLILCSCHKAKDPLDRVSELLGTDASDYTVTTYFDNHGSWLGDGKTVMILNLTPEQALCLDRDTQNHFCRRALPFSDPVRIALYGGKIIRGGVEWDHGALFGDDSGHPLLPEITSGFYLFYDRHGETTDPSDDAHLHTRGSWNFDLAVYDADTRTLYYLVLDT